MDLRTTCCNRKNLPAVQNAASRSCGCRGSMCCPRVFATMSVFARPVFARCLRTPTCFRDDASFRPTCLREMSSPAHVSSRRRVSSPDLSSGSVVARPCVFATTRVLAPPVCGTCLRPSTCLRDDARPVFGNCLLVRTGFHYWKCLGKGSLSSLPAVSSQ